MSTLNDYMQDVQRLLRDQSQELWNPGDLLRYINLARREVAARAQCVRVLTPISGAVITASVTAGGSGYTNSPTLTITAPDFPSGTGPFPGGSQATAAAIVSAGVILAINITYGGSGYFQPLLTITDSTGTGATGTLQVQTFNQLNANQERYAFSDIDLSQNPGVESVYMVKSISVIYANYRYSLPVYAFSVYQAMIRQYPFQYTYVPSFASQYGQGTDGSFFVYPLPSQTYQYELDAFCLPSDLLTNLSVDVIPQPWSDAVAEWALHLAYEEIQNYNVARYYFEMFDKKLQRKSDYARSGRTVNPYGRY